MTSNEPAASAAAATAEAVRRAGISAAGVLSRRDLLGLGMTYDEIESHIRARRWAQVGRAVVLHRGPLTREQRWAAALIHVGDGSCLAAWSALEAAGLQGWDREDVHVIVRRGRHVRPLPGLVVHESRRFEPDGDIQNGAVRRTNPARSAVDAAAWTPSRRGAAGILVATVQHRLSTVVRVRAELQRAGAVRHARLLRATVEDIAGGSQSLAEIDMGRLVRAAGFAGYRRQVVRRDAAGRRRYLDLELDLPSGEVLVVEIDGSPHLDVSQWLEDQLRANEVTLQGRSVVRFPALLVRCDPERIVRQLAQVRDRHQRPTPVRSVA